MSLRIRLHKLEEKARTDGRTTFEIWINNNGILTQTRTGEQLSREEFQQRYPDARSIELKWNLGEEAMNIQSRLAKLEARAQANQPSAIAIGYESEDLLQLCKSDEQMTRPSFSGVILTG